MTGSEEEILAFKSVIDWLNGRARALEIRQERYRFWHLGVQVLLRCLHVLIWVQCALG